MFKEEFDSKEKCCVAISRPVCTLATQITSHSAGQFRTIQKYVISFLQRWSGEISQRMQDAPLPNLSEGRLKCFGSLSTFSGKLREQSQEF